MCSSWTAIRQGKGYHKPSQGPKRNINPRDYGEPLPLIGIQKVSQPCACGPDPHVCNYQRVAFVFGCQRIGTRSKPDWCDSAREATLPHTFQKVGGEPDVRRGQSIDERPHKHHGAMRIVAIARNQRRHDIESVKRPNSKSEMVGDLPVANAADCDFTDAHNG